MFYEINNIISEYLINHKGLINSAIPPLLNSFSS